MLLELKKHAADVIRTAANYEARIDNYYKENQDEAAEVLDEMTREIRARAGLYGSEVPDDFKSKSLALAFLAERIKELRAGVIEGAAEFGCIFEFQLSRDYESAAMLKECADALVILLN